MLKESRFSGQGAEPSDSIINYENYLMTCNEVIYEITCNYHHKPPAKVNQYHLEISFF